MTTIERTRRLASTAVVVGGGLALALAMSGCASDATTTNGSGSGTPAPRADSASVAPSGTASTPPVDDPADDPAGDPTADPTGAEPDRTTPPRTTSVRTSLTTLSLRRSDLPDGFEAGSRIDGIVRNRELRNCVGPAGTAHGVLGRVTSPSFGETTSVVATIVSRYQSDADRDADVAVLRSAKAEKCFTALFLKQNEIDGGSPVRSTTAEIRPGTNDGPSNEAGVASVNLVVDEDGRGSRQTVSIGVYYLTGPRTLTQLIFQGHGTEFDNDVADKVLTTMATRTRRG